MSLVGNSTHKGLHFRLPRTSKTSWPDGMIAKIDRKTAPTSSMRIPILSSTSWTSCDFRQSSPCSGRRKQASTTHCTTNLKQNQTTSYFTDLREWIQNKRYLEAVQIVVDVKVLSEEQLENPRNRTIHGADVEVDQSFFGLYSGKKSF